MGKRWVGDPSPTWARGRPRPCGPPGIHSGWVVRLTAGHVAFLTAPNSAFSPVVGARTELRASVSPIRAVTELGLEDP